MKTYNGTRVFYPIYYPDGSETTYLIKRFYDLDLKQCLAEIEDINDSSVEDIRLMTKWIPDADNLYKGSVGDGIVLKKEIIEMIDINFFENFHA